MHPLETYLRDLHDIRATGAAVEETSYYPPLANLLNAVGQALKPRVRCVINLRNAGAGLPDGGLFTPDQLQRGADVPLDGQPPARGAMSPQMPAAAPTPTALDIGLSVLDNPRRNGPTRRHGTVRPALEIRRGVMRRQGRLS